MKYRPYHEQGGGILFAIILGIIIGIAAGYFGNIYITESASFFQYKSWIIGAAAGIATGIVVHMIAGFKHRY